MNLYKNHSDRELVAVLDKAAALTYEAQCNLLKEVRQRSLPRSTDELEQLIAITDANIADFEILRDLGFTSNYETQGDFVIARDRKAVLMDVVAVVVGVLLVLIGLIHFWLLIALFTGNNEFTLTKLITSGLMVVLGGIGFKMLSAIHRLLDYNNFELRQHLDTIKVRRGNHYSTYSSSNIALELIEDELIFKLGEEELIYGSAHNLKQRLTLEALVHKLKVAHE